MCSKNDIKVTKSPLNLEEFLHYQALGCKRPSFQGKWIIIKYPCKKCGKEHVSRFQCMMHRNQKYIDLCTSCASSIHSIEVNKTRGGDFYNNKERCEKISRGIKKNYQLLGEEAVLKRQKTKLKNFKKNGVPDFSNKRLIVEGIYCASYGEGIFIQWKLSQGYEVSKCNFHIDYELNGTKNIYIPDFIIKKNNITTLIEVKCDYLRNFREKKAEGLRARHLSTYGLDELSAKIEVAKAYCLKRGWNFELITLDNKEFQLLYHKDQRKRYADRKKNNNSL